MGSFYKPPSNTDSQNGDKTVILGGDFNARGINWESQTMMTNYDNPRMCEELIQM